MPHSNNDLLIEVLRAAGHPDAAELATKVLAHNEPAEPEAEAEVPKQTSADAFQAEAQALGEALEMGITSKWHSGGSL